MKTIDTRTLTPGTEYYSLSIDNWIMVGDEPERDEIHVGDFATLEDAIEATKTQPAFESLIIDRMSKYEKGASGSPIWKGTCNGPDHGWPRN